VNSFEEITAWYQTFILRGFGASQQDVDAITGAPNARVHL
jgi:hypothetical protein